MHNPVLGHRWRSRRSRFAAGASGLALASTLLSVVAPATSAHANPTGTGLVISEVYGGGGNVGGLFRDDFIELYNPTAAPISLDGLSLQYRSAAGNAAGTQVLTGSVPAQTHWLVQEAAGANTSEPALPAPDATGTFAMSSTGGQVLLIDGMSFTGSGDLAGNPGLADMVGWGSTTTSFETAVAPGTSNPVSVSRDAAGTDIDDNSADFTAGPPDPQDSAGNAAPLSVTSIGDRTVPTGVAINPITLAATGGAPPYTWSADALPDGLTLTGDTISGAPTTAGTYHVTVTASDSSEPAQTAATTFTLTAADAQAVSIAQIQGTNTDTSPLAGQIVSTQGVVTAVYATGGFNGFYIQTGGTGGSQADDQTPGASDAVFVFGSISAQLVHIGESVDVTGTAAEFAGQTEIDFPTVTQLATPLPAVQPDTIPWSDLATDAQKEAHEGELMAPQGDFTVTDNFNTNFFGEIELASGDQTLREPTDAGQSDSQAAQDAVAYDAAHAVTLDDGSSTTFQPTNSSSKDLPLPWLTPSTPVSVGSRATFHQPVILDFRNSLWKFQPTLPISGDGSAVATFSDQRTANALPADVGGNVRLATFNVENFFPTTGEAFVADNPGARCTYFDDRDGNHIAVNDCSFANGAPGPRGAATDASFQRQLAKIVYGINHLGASIVSLEEIENSEKFASPRDSAVQTLVDALNAEAGAGTWAFAPSPPDADLPPIAGQDVIRTAFIYKPADVSLVGASHVLADDSGAGQPFSIAREPLAQGFKAAGAPDSDAFLVVANHLKSKSADAAKLFSDCASGGDSESTDPAADQGAFNCTRLHEAQDMWTFAQQQAQALNTDKIFLVGDLNSYGHEDPMQFLLGQGFTDLGAQFDPAHWSYSFDGLEGSLDHVLASPGAMSLVTGATIWQINAQESVAGQYSRFNYSPTQLFDPNSPWAASDHDPVVVGLHLPVPSTVAATTDSFVWNRRANIGVTVSAGGVTPTGTVEMHDGSKLLGTTELTNGAGVIHLRAMLLRRGTYTFTLVYSGDDAVQGSSADVTFHVTNRNGH